MKRHNLTLVLPAIALLFASACGNDGTSTRTTPTPPVQDITLAGVVSDSPVLGGSVFVFEAARIQAVLDDASAADDRLASLAAASPLATLARDPAAGDTYTIDVGGDLAGQAVFLVFDGTDAEDDTFGGEPPNLESVALLGDAGSTQNVNISVQSSIVAAIVRAVLDPDNNGTIIDTAAIGGAIDTANTDVAAAFRRDAIGREIYDDGFDPLRSTDTDAVHAASTAAGFILRAIATSESIDLKDAIDTLAEDLGDGTLDGDIALAGHDEEIDVFANGACSSAAVALRHACAVDVVDDLLETTAICLDMPDDEERADCETDAALDRIESEEECDDVFDARLAVCEATADAAHEPAFGPAYAANFVDPLDIGDTVPPNPWFPLVTGNTWLYEGGDEVIEVVVTGETKLIQGITCVVVVDTVTEDGALLELTRDWYAQDTAGDVWYCGEIARNYEVFNGDVPDDPELVDIEGSWKAGRDGAEPGVLLPFSPVVGATMRQEVLFGEAEDVVDILSLTATESAPGGACNGDCLQTADYTPLEPDALEHKFYAPGIGLIVETDPATGERLELVETVLN